MKWAIIKREARQRMATRRQDQAKRLAAEARSKKQNRTHATAMDDDELLARADDPHNFAELFTRYSPGIEIYLSDRYTGGQVDRTLRVVDQLWSMIRKLGTEVRSLRAIDDAGHCCFLLGGRQPAPVRASLYYLASELAINQGEVR